MPLRIDLVDPGSEGATLVSGLRAAGFDVELRPLAQVARTEADVLVLAGDLDGALDALRALRDDGASPDTPVVLLGTPSGTGHRGEGAGFGAQAVLLRPILLGRLIDAIERVTAPPQSAVSASRPARRERTIQLGTGTASNEKSGVHPGDGSGRPLEATMQLRDQPITGVDPLRENSSVAARTPASVAPPGSQAGTPGTGPGSTGSGDSVAPSSSGGVRGPTASLSDHLRSLLLAADRRAFPNRPPIDLALPAGDESAADLVPGELLEHDDLALDVVPDEDPIDAFTYVGGPVLPSAPGVPDFASQEEPDSEPGAEPVRQKTAPGTPTSLSRRPGARDTLPPAARPPTEIEPPQGWESGSREPGATGVQAARVRPPSIVPPPPPSRAPSEWPSEDSVLGRVTPDGGRRGSLADGGALRLLLRVCELGLDARVAITPADGETIMLAIGAGELLAIEGPIASRAIEVLRRRGARVGPAGDNLGAERALDEAIERGAITTFERDRALREGRERVIAEIVSAPRAMFSLARVDPDELPARGPSPLGATLRIATVEAARRAIDRKRARAILGGSVELRRGVRFDALAAEGLIAPEIVSLVQRLEGEPMERMIDEAPDEPGLVGLLCALVAARALHATPIDPPDPAPAERARNARRMIEDAGRLADDGDYFAILGIAPDATDRDVANAHRARTEQLASIPLDELGLAALEPVRSAAHRAVAEAGRVLSVPRWRAAYAAALVGPLTSGPVSSGQGSPGQATSAHLAGSPSEH